GEAATAGPIDLPDFGWVKFRKADVAEPHMWQPLNVKALQTVVGSTRAGVPSDDPTAAFHIFSEGVDSREAATLRDLLEIRPAGPALGLDEVEKPADLCKRFIAS